MWTTQPQTSWTTSDARRMYIVSELPLIRRKSRDCFTFFIILLAITEMPSYLRFLHNRNAWFFSRYYLRFLWVASKSNIITPFSNCSWIVIISVLVFNKITSGKPETSGHRQISIDQFHSFLSVWKFFVGGNPILPRAFGMIALMNHQTSFPLIAFLMSFSRTIYANIGCINGRFQSSDRTYHLQQKIRLRFHT